MNSRQYEKDAINARTKGLPHVVTPFMEELIAFFAGNGGLDKIRTGSSILVVRKTGKDSYREYRDCWNFELDPELDTGCIVFVDLDSKDIDVCTFSDGDWVDICSELRAGAEVAITVFKS